MVEDQALHLIGSMRLTENKALAILLANFRKTSKFSDPVLFAESALYLARLYGSPEAVAEKLEVGRETVRALTKVAEMPASVKRQISRGRLRLTVAFDLIPFEPSLQSRLAKEIAGLPFKDARAVIRYAAEHPKKTLIQARGDALEELEKRELNIAVIRLPRSIYKTIINNTPDREIAILCKKWLEQGAPQLPDAIPEQETLRLIVRLPRQTHQELKRKSRNVANLVERIVIHYLK